MSTTGLGRRLTAIAPEAVKPTKFAPFANYEDRLKDTTNIRSRDAYTQAHLDAMATAVAKQKVEQQTNQLLDELARGRSALDAHHQTGFVSSTEQSRGFSESRDDSTFGTNHDSDQISEDEAQIQHRATQIRLHRRYSAASQMCRVPPVLFSTVAGGGSQIPQIPQVQKLFDKNVCTTQFPKEPTKIPHSKPPNWVAHRLVSMLLRCRPDVGTKNSLADDESLQQYDRLVYEVLRRQVDADLTRITELEVQLGKLRQKLSDASKRLETSLPLEEKKQLVKKKEVLFKEFSQLRKSWRWPLLLFVRAEEPELFSRLAQPGFPLRVPNRAKTAALLGVLHAERDHRIPWRIVVKLVDDWSALSSIRKKKKNQQKENSVSAINTERTGANTLASSSDPKMVLEDILANRKLPARVLAALLANISLKAPHLLSAKPPSEIHVAVAPWQASLNLCEKATKAAQQLLQRETQQNNGSKNTVQSPASLNFSFAEGKRSLRGLADPFTAAAARISALHSGGAPLSFIQQEVMRITDENPKQLRNSMLWSAYISSCQGRGISECFLVPPGAIQQEKEEQADLFEAINLQSQNGENSDSEQATTAPDRKTHQPIPLWVHALSLVDGNAKSYHLKPTSSMYMASMEVALLPIPSLPHLRADAASCATAAVESSSKQADAVANLAPILSPGAWEVAVRCMKKIVEGNHKNPPPSRSWALLLLALARGKQWDLLNQVLRDVIPASIGKDHLPFSHWPQQLLDVIKYCRMAEKIDRNAKGEGAVAASGSFSRLEGREEINFIELDHPHGNLEVSSGGISPLIGETIEDETGADFKASAMDDIQQKETTEEEPKILLKQKEPDTAQPASGDLFF